MSALFPRSLRLSFAFCFSLTAFATGLLLSPANAYAGTAEEADTKKKSSDEEDDKAEAKAEDKAEDAAAEDQAKPAATSSKESNSPFEEPGKTYLFVGARYRGVIVPKFMMNLFGDGGRTLYVNSVGGEFIIRSDGRDLNLGLWYADYSMAPTPFKGKGEKAEAWEIAESKLSMLYVTADLLWSHPLSSELSFAYGAGLGFGYVFGDLYRTQAKPGPGANMETGDGFVPCKTPGDGDPKFCGDPKTNKDEKDHYPGYTEPNWANGGSTPVVFPWVAAQVGLRYKPVKQFVGRLDLGFGTSGLFFGVGLDYGL